MFDNIGSKIKSLASVIAWIGIIVSVLSGIVLCITQGFVVGILVAGLGSLSAWIGSFMQYGFGQLIENSDYLVKVAKTTHNGGNGAIVYQHFAPVPPGAYQPTPQSVTSQYAPYAVPTSPNISRTNNAANAPSQQPSPSWICSSCGYTNRTTAHCCAQCGTIKAWSEQKQEKQTSETYDNYVIGSKKP